VYMECGIFEERAGYVGALMHGLQALIEEDEELEIILVWSGELC